MITDVTDPALILLKMLSIPPIVAARFSHGEMKLMLIDFKQKMRELF
jgi:hypothetical protein